MSSTHLIVKTHYCRNGASNLPSRRLQGHPAFQPVEQQHNLPDHDHRHHRQQRQRLVDEEGILRHAQCQRIDIDHSDRGHQDGAFHLPHGLPANRRQGARCRACGSQMRRNAVKRDMPIAHAPVTGPPGTLLNAPRFTSPSSKAASYRPSLLTTSAGQSSPPTLPKQSSETPPASPSAGSAPPQACPSRPDSPADGSNPHPACSRTECATLTLRPG